MANCSISVKVKWWVAPALFVVTFSPLRYMLPVTWLREFVTKYGFEMETKVK